MKKLRINRGFERKMSLTWVVLWTPHSQGKDEVRAHPSFFKTRVWASSGPLGEAGEGPQQRGWLSGLALPAASRDSLESCWWLEGWRGGGTGLASLPESVRSKICGFPEQQIWTMWERAGLEPLKFTQATYWGKKVQVLVTQSCLTLQHYGL